MFNNLYCAPDSALTTNGALRRLTPSIGVADFAKRKNRSVPSGIKM
jgi:hypothetical protein